MKCLFSPPRLYRGALVTLACLALLCPSCARGPRQKAVYPVHGKVLFQGRPVSPGLLVFHPVDASVTERPTAQTRPDGSFRVSTYSDKDGAPAGEYAVTVLWTPQVRRGNGEPELGPNVLPPRFTRPESSGLHVRVDEGPNEVPTFDLK